MPTPEQLQALHTARALVGLGYSAEQVLSNSLIPATSRDFVREQIERDQNFPLIPARILVRDAHRPDWLRDLDRSGWLYWPTLRQYLLTTKGWSLSAVRSLDDSSDKVVRQLMPPSTVQFDIRGLVLGYVQSGKTANYTAVIAKAADAGYRLVVVLSGIDNGLRRQTNVRLKRELVGFPDNRPSAVRLPEIGRRWHEFTRETLNGDFQPGYANHAALQGSQPVIVVVKKNGQVLRRLLGWLGDAPADVLRTIPMLVVDDEADLASVDVRGSYQAEEVTADDTDYEDPSVINGLVRQLLNQFHRRAYIAYTATPFANVLVPHDTIHRNIGNDLYPKDFIIDLPKPPGYFGAEEIFGRMDDTNDVTIGGLDVIREVSDTDLAALESGEIPTSLVDAISDFVLAGAARSQRSGSDFPATMLIHTSPLIAAQAQLRPKIAEHFADLRDSWRYHRDHGIYDRLRERWNTEFRPRIRSRHLEKDVAFEVIEPQIGPFFEAIDVREINSATGEVLDYEQEPNLKAVAIGGNRLSRGLTLEGLLTSYFVRRAVSYDTLMQMGRWFGFREGYEDLTRIYTTPELETWFSDLAYVEHELRRDIEIYESQGLTPYEVGLRIWQHPTMQVTSPLKRRFASSTTISQTYSGALQQTFKFPLDWPHDLGQQADENLAAVRQFISRLPARDERQTDQSGPVWTGISVDTVLQFLRTYQVDNRASSISLPLVCAYVERVRDAGELTTWTVAVRGRGTTDPELGTAEWGLPSPLAQVTRSRLGKTNSVGVITAPGDELCGLSEEKRAAAQAVIDAAGAQGKTKSVNSAAREVRDPADGLLLLYPISRFSGYNLDNTGNRRRLLDNPNSADARDLVGLAISFPTSQQPQEVEAYLEGTVGWRPVD